MSPDDRRHDPDEHLELAIDVTKRDVLTGGLLKTLRPSASSCFGYLCGGAVLAVVFFGGPERGPAATLVTIAFALGCALWLALSMVDLLWLLLVRLRQESWRRQRLGRQTIELAPTGVSWQVAGSIKRIAWADVTGVSLTLGALRIDPNGPAIPLCALPHEWPPANLLKRLRDWQQAAADLHPMARWKRRLGLLGHAALIGMVCYALIQFHALNEALTQHQNTWNLAHGSWKSVLDYRQEHGRLPDTLTDLPAFFQRDAYGRPLVYQVRGERFLLVSLGRDGLPDPGDPWTLAEGLAHSLDATPPVSYLNNCARPDADSVVSDRGLHVGCYRK